MLGLSLAAQTYKSQSLEIIPGDITATDTVFQLDGDIGGTEWSLTIEADACDSVIFGIGGSNYETDPVTHVYAYDVVLKDTFVRAANLDTINGVDVQTETYTGTDFPYTVPLIRYYKHATASDTINIKLKNFR